MLALGTNSGSIRSSPTKRFTEVASLLVKNEYVIVLELISALTQKSYIQKSISISVTAWDCVGIYDYFRTLRGEGCCGFHVNVILIPYSI